jgi:transcriptional regulator with PAS, ATPase and Fis domain
LLRVLEQRTIRRIGGKEEIPVEVTAIATTNRNLAEAVENGDFRRDLFFRLSSFYLHIIPLRERREDISMLAKHFLSYFSEKYNKKAVKQFSPEAEKMLLSSDWPGNVRELKNLVERIVVLENSETIEPGHLPHWLLKKGGTKGPSSSHTFALPDSGISLEDLEKDLILQALEKADHNKTMAAKLLDMSYDSLRYQLKKYGIK